MEVPSSRAPHDAEGESLARPREKSRRAGVPYSIHSSEEAPDFPKLRDASLLSHLLPRHADKDSSNSGGPKSCEQGRTPRRVRCREGSLPSDQRTNKTRERARAPAHFVYVTRSLASVSMLAFLFVCLFSPPFYSSPTTRPSLALAFAFRTKESAFARDQSAPKSRLKKESPSAPGVGGRSRREPGKRNVSGILVFTVSGFLPPRGNLFRSIFLL